MNLQTIFRLLEHTSGPEEKVDMPSGQSDDEVEVFTDSDDEEKLPTPTGTLLFYCPVCLSDEIEPNGMHTTCTGGHTCCRECYQGMVDSGNYQCPTCRDYLRGGPLFLQLSTDPGKMPDVVRDQLRKIKREADTAEGALKITREEHRNIIDAFRRKHQFRIRAAKEQEFEYKELCRRKGPLSPAAKLPDALLHSEKEIKQMKRRHKKLAAKIYQMRSELQKLEESCPSSLEKIRLDARLDDKIERKTEENKHWQGVLEDCKKEVSSTTKELENIHGKGRLLSEIADLENQISDLETKLSEMESSKESLRAELSGFCAERARLTAEISELKAAVRKEISAHKRWESKAKKQKKCFESLSAQNKDLLEKNKDLEEKNQQLISIMRELFGSQKAP